VGGEEDGDERSGSGAVISERIFAERYTSFWRQALPMGKEVTDAINNDLRQQFAGYRRQPDRDVRHDLISEVSLRWFAARVVEGRLADRPPEAGELQRLATEASAFVARLRGSPVPELPPPSPTEVSEAEDLTRILVAFVSAQDDRGSIVPRPPFAGCGLLAACRGDLLIGQTLYEVKAVDRGFHQPDVRQLVTYCALNFAAPRYDIRRIGLVNPQRGTFFRSDLEWIVRNLAGRGAAELFHEIVDFLSTERISA
jgi:hypothetical protein